MSQMNVNFLDPVTSSGAQAAEGFRSNLVEKARLDLEHTRIATQADLQKAQIDAEVEMKRAEMQHGSVLQAESQKFQAGQQTQQLTAQQQMAQKRLEAEAALEKQRQDFTASQQDKLMQHDEDLVNAANERLGLSAEKAAGVQRELAKKMKDTQDRITGLTAENVSAQMEMASAQNKAKGFSDEVTKAATESLGHSKAVYDSTGEITLHAIQQAKTNADLGESRGLSRWAEHDPTERDPTVGGVGIGLGATSKGMGDVMRFVEGTILGKSGVRYPETVHNNSGSFVDTVAPAIADGLSKVVPTADKAQVAAVIKQGLDNVRAVNAANDTSISDAEYAKAGRDRAADKAQAAKGLQETVNIMRKLGFPDDVTFGALDTVAKHAESVSDDVQRREGDAKGMSYNEQQQAAKSFRLLHDAGGVARAAVIANKGMPKPSTHMEQKSMLDGVATFAASILDRSVTKEELQKNLDQAGFGPRTIAKLMDHFEKIPHSQTSEQMKNNLMLIQSKIEGEKSQSELDKQEAAARTAEESAKVLRVPLPRMKR